MYLESSSPDETVEIGRKMGRFLKAGDVVCLYGDIGSGKTTMIKGIASAFGIASRDITSASFTIIAEHESTPPFYHIDLYRLKGGDDVFETGIYDCLEQDGVSVIEWAERLDMVPDGSLQVKMSIIEEHRRGIEIEGLDEEDWDNL